MADPIISPDGEWMWTGSDWIPAPPESYPSEIQSEKSDSRLNEIRLTLPEYRQEIEMGGVIIGGILLFISFNTLTSPNPVIFGGEFVILKTQGQVCFSLMGIIGLLIFIFGIQGKKIAENPKRAIIYHLSKSSLSYAQLQEKIGLKGWQFRKIIHEMENEGTLNVEKDPTVGNRFSLK
ncbi:MAG: hypothetical protein ACPG83_03190 [Candidatus Poseidoniaceae archaeon]